ncbi:MAG: molybdopterin-dependent oxidoreductase [Coriobacteriales bacterium]|nr:molybdopterin-dependent oxidoreductase [Coriobacteriales bacterium]
MLGNKISRRSFVKTAAVAGIAAAAQVSLLDSFELTSAAYADSEPDVKVYKTMCHGCINYCAVKVTVKDGVAVRIVGDEDSGINKSSVCLKGLNQLHTLYSPRHVLHPMRHIERGTNKWETISWDEAIDLAATQITDAIKKYGPYSFFATGGGGGAYTGGMAYDYPFGYGSPNSFEPGGAQCFMPRANMAPLTYGGRPPSIADSFLNEPFKGDGSTKMLVLWGAQPSISQTALSGRGMADLRNGFGCKTVVVDPHFSPDAAKADVWLPLRPGTDTALVLCWWRYLIENKLYDEQFVKYWTNLPFLINPETRLPYLAEEVWPDYVNPAADPNEEFSTPAYVCFDNKTGAIAPFPFSAPEDSPVDPEIFCSAEVNGVEAKTAGQIYWEEAEPWTLDATAEYCWLKAEKIEEAIKLYAEAEVAGIAHGVATDQMRSSSEVPLGVNGLDMLMGYVNKPGSCLNLLSTQYKDRPTQWWDPFGMGRWCNATGVGWCTGKTEKWNRERVENFPDKDTQAQWWQRMEDRAGLKEHKGFLWQDNCHIPTMLKYIRSGEPYKPRVWYEFSGNKLAMLGNAQSWYDIRGEIDFCIQQYPNLTSFSFEFVDLFLPTEEWLEWTGSASILNKKFIFAPIIHLGETVHNEVPSRRILAKAKEKLDPWPVSDVFPVNRGSMTEKEIQDNTAKQFGAETMEELMADQDKFVPVVTPEDVYWKYYQHLDIVSDGLPAGFATESRKCEPYCTLLLRMSRTGFPFTYPYELPACQDYNPICVNILPVEDPTTDTEYPYVITSGRVPYFHHGTMRHAAFSRELYPAPKLHINPETAAECGVEDGDWVKVSSRRGSISAIALVTKTVAPRVLWMERFWNPEAFDDSQENPDGGWRQCNINVITDNFVDSDFDHPYNGPYGSYTLRGFTVKVEKGEKPANIWIEPKEFEPFLPTLTGEPNTGVVF